jgi:hypothetical protein
MRHSLAARLLLAVALIVSFQQQCIAHPLGFSGFRFLLWQDHAKAIYTLHTRDMSDWFPPLKYRDYVNDVSREIVKEPGELLEVTFDGQAISPTEKKAFSPEVGMIQVELTYPIAKFPQAVALWSKQLIRLPRGHQQLLFVEDMRHNPDGESGPSLYEGALSSDQDGATVEIPATASLGLPTTLPTGFPSSQPATMPAPIPATTRSITTRVAVRVRSVNILPYAVAAIGLLILLITLATRQRPQR